MSEEIKGDTFSTLNTKLEDIELAEFVPFSKSESDGAKLDHGSGGIVPLRAA